MELLPQAGVTSQKFLGAPQRRVLRLDRVLHSSAGAAAFLICETNESFYNLFMVHCSLLPTIISVFYCCCYYFFVLPPKVLFLFLRRVVCCLFVLIYLDAFMPTFMLPNNRMSEPNPQPTTIHHHQPDGQADGEGCTCRGTSAARLYARALQAPAPTRD